MLVMTATRLPQDDLFDDAAGYDSDIGVRFADGLTTIERRQATVLYNMFNELWGLCIVVGDPGTGKDTFGNWLAYSIKRYFPWKRIWRDEKPRRLFGTYAGLFNDEVIVKELAKMREVAKTASATRVDEVLEKAADDWVSSHGVVLLQNSLIYLTEFWRYCSRREPHSPMNKTMGGIHKEKRHLDALIVGTTQMVSDLDRKTCLPWVDWRVTCTHSRTNKTGFTFFIEKVKYDKRLDLLFSASRPLAIPVDAGKPRSFMDDGRIVIRRPDYKPETEEERVVLAALKIGVDTYDRLVELLETEGDMSEPEVLDTLKELRFGKSNGRLKWVVDYACYFGLFNSKSAPQMQTSIKIDN